MGSNTVQISREGRRLRLTADLPVGVRDAVFRIQSDRNAKIDTLTDTSPHAPKRKADPNTETVLDNQQMWLPIVDMRLRPEMAALVRFSGAGIATFAINGMFNKEAIKVHDEVIIPADKLLQWENAIFVDGPDREVANFRIIVPAGGTGGTAQASVDLLSDDWSGTVELVADGKLLGEAGVERLPLSKPKGLPGKGLSSDRITESLKASVGYLIRSQVPQSDSIVSEGLYLFYDHDARTFRTPHWNWAWGPAIRLLLEAAHAPVTSAGEKDAAARAARGVGAASLRFQMRDPSHKAYGYSLGRWSPGLRNMRKLGYVSPSSDNFPVAGWSPSYAAEKFEGGFEGYYSPADSLFLAGWGWVPLGETGDARFSEAAALCAEAGRRQLETFEIVPQDMPVLVNDWTNYTREEAGFGMEAYAELYRATTDRKYLETGRKYIDGLLEKLEMPNGLWNRHWWRNTRERTPCEYKSRSLGWAEMGLQAAHRMSPDQGNYLERAVKLADHFLQAQDESGAWGLLIDRPIGQTEKSAKGTALWSMLLYRLHKLTGDPRHLAAARKALGWLMDNQYFGTDPDGQGGVISCSPFSGVNYRRWYKLSCAYTSSFFGLAALEELRLS